MRRRGSLMRSAALLMLGLTTTACHGRPLESQMAPGSDPRAAGLAAPGHAASERRARGPDRREMERYSRARKLFEGRSPFSPVENVMERKDYGRLADAQARRAPPSSEPRAPETFVRERVDGVLANAAQPSFLNPEKAFMPGELCVDPFTLTLAAIRILRDPEASWQAYREAYRKDRPGR